MPHPLFATPSSVPTTPQPVYYVLVYNTVTGQVIGSLPDANQTEPIWLQQINNTGSVTWQTIVDGKTLTRDQLITFVEGEWRFGLALCYGTGSINDFICQAGPITASVDMSESPPIVRFTALGFWGLLNKCQMVNPTWAGTDLTAAGGADVTYTSSLQGIAALMLTDAMTRNPLPLDIPAPITGTATRTYYGYELTSVGQRLSELTQVQNGPDILFLPYFSTATTIRHRAVIGNPTLTQPGTPLVFNYPGTLRSVLRVRDGSQMATNVIAAGQNSGSYTVLWGTATDTTLTGLGWPKLFMADTSHTDVVDQPTITGWAQGDQGFYGRSVETWAAVARMDKTPVFGSFTPGVYGLYNMQGHQSIRDGVYSQRIVGIGSGVGNGTMASVTPGVGEYLQILQNTAGQI